MALLLALAACNDEMSHQPRYDTYTRSTIFPNGTSMQAPPDGTIARDDPAPEALAERPPMTAALLARGRERFGITCAVCHDAAGTGHGTVPARGFPTPPDFGEPRLVAAPSAYLVEVITHGHGVMYPYADRVAPADRWAIAAYIRALQLSRGAAVADLPAEDRARIEEAGGG